MQGVTYNLNYSGAKSLKNFFNGVSAAAGCSGESQMSSGQFDAEFYFITTYH